MKTKPDQQASVTFQAPLTRKESLERLAFQLGLRRLVDGKESGNVSGIVNLIIEYVFDSRDKFAEWLKERAARAMKSE